MVSGLWYRALPASLRPQDPLVFVAHVLYALFGLQCAAYFLLAYVSGNRCDVTHHMSSNVQAFEYDSVYLCCVAV